MSHSTIENLYWINIELKQHLPPKINMSPRKGPFQKESSLPTIILEGLCYFSGEYIWVFPTIGVPENGWFIVENPVKIDYLEVPLFLEIPIKYFKL